MKNIKRLICEPHFKTNLVLKKQKNIFRYWEHARYKENKEILHRDIFSNAFKKIISKSHRIPTQTLWCRAYAGHDFYTLQLKIVEKKYLLGGISKNIWAHKIQSAAAMSELYALMLKKDIDCLLTTKIKYLFKLIFYNILSSRKADQC